jgi:hypothetical protein
MVRVTKGQAAHTYGVLDPHLAERYDTKFINGSLSEGRNIIMLPQGGYTDRGGTNDFGRVRQVLEPRAYTAPMVTLPNGGTAANLLAGVEIVTGAASGARFVLADIDFGAATKVHFIDIGSVAADTAGADGALIAEYWTGSTWAAFGAPLLLTASKRSRRLAIGAPGHAGVTANRFRVAINGTLASGAIRFAGLKFWGETNELADGVAWRHAPAKDLNCVFVATAGNVDVYELGIWRASFATKLNSSQLSVAKPEARSESLLIFHEDIQPEKATMLGSVVEWSSAPIDFENIPNVDYGAVYINGITAIQSVAFYSFSNGDLFDLTLEGLVTSAIEFSTTMATTVANIQAALEDLSIVDVGLTVTDETIPGVYTVNIEFTGGANANRDWIVMSANPLSGVNGYVRVRTLQRGKAGGEPIISLERGYPAVGRFAQQRLVMAGLKSRPLDILATVSGSVSDLNTELGIATGAISYEVDASANTEIRDIAIGRTLLFSGDQQVVYLRAAVLSATEAPQFGTSDAPGISPICPIVSSDNALFYIQEGGNTLRQLNYTELEQNYVGDNASLLSAHIVRDIVSVTRRRAVGAIDSDLIIMVNGDGTITALTMMRTQEVSGFAPWATDGFFRNAVVDNINNLWLLVKRGCAGNQTLRLEMADPDGLLDEAETRVIDYGLDALTGLSRFEARLVYVIANDTVYGPLLVNGGQVTLPEMISGKVLIGTWTSVRATDHAFQAESEQQRRMARLKRVNRVQLSLIDTSHVALEVNSGAAFEVALTNNDDMTFDQGELARPFTGRVECEGMHGFTAGAQVTVTQLRPGKLTCRAVIKDIVA